MTRKLNIVLLALMVAIGGPFYWLLLNATTASDARHPVTIAQLRRLAGDAVEQGPIDIRYETLGRRRVISDLLAAGSGLRPMPFVVRAFELVLPDGDVITLDRGISRQIAYDEDLANFDPRAQAAVERALASARLSLILAPRMVHAGSRTVPRGLAANHREDLPPDRPYPVAPGIVVIPAADVGPGERMVYVRMADGAELLFAGDIAPSRLAWSETRPPARLATSYPTWRDREALGAWLRTVAALKVQAPHLGIVAGHDQQLPRALKKGFIAAADQSLRPAR